MAPTVPKPENLLGLTVGEAKVLLLGILCSDENGKVNTEKLTQRGNYKNTASAGTSYRTAKRRLIEMNPEESDEEDAGAPPAAAAGQPSEASGDNTPKKRPGRPKRTPATVAQPAHEEVPPTPKPKRQRKAAAKKGIARKAIKKDSYEGSSDDAMKSDPTPSKMEIVKKDEDETDEYKTEDELPMSTEQLDAELEAMESSQDASKPEADS
ncbi:hypothetical protein BDV25DRAFT_137699 [Aspergillus avenaceus]|uniref:Uncharacterized protein n=1 Tax=Aspergillus avenaceus TaxID=36643 RepID=A0A5N6U287_ASPAV|nr:hypothetical protein BDV25DRAFT_137699 [Aspergillus avenaceus]